MNLPMDVVKIASFNEGHFIKTSFRSYEQNSGKTHKREPKRVLLIFDEKVTLYLYSVGGIVLLNDPVKRVGVSGKLRRVWCGLYQTTWLSSHNCRVIILG